MKILTFIRTYRVVSLIFMTFCCVLAWTISIWFMGTDSPNNAQGGFASAVVLALVGIGKYWMETRANDGEDKIEKDIRWNRYDHQQELQRYLQLRNLNRTPMEDQWFEQTKQKMKELERQHEELQKRKSL